jgi:hypothetical protein
MAVDTLTPAQRLRRTIRMLAGVQLGPHGHGDVGQLRTGSIAGPYGTFGPGSLLPGKNAVQDRTMGAAPASAGGTFGVAAANAQAQQQGQPMPLPPNTPAGIAQHIYDLQHGGGSAADIQAAATSLSQLLRPRRASRGGHSRAGKAAGTVPGRPYLP